MIWKDGYGWIHRSANPTDKLTFCGLLTDCMKDLKDPNNSRECPKCFTDQNSKEKTT